MTIKQLFAGLTVLAAIANTIPVKSQEVEKSHPDSYNRISISYRNVNFGFDGGGLNFNGGSFDYIHGFGVSKSIPIYVETGVSAAFTTKDFGSGSYGGYMTIDVPINCSYRFAIPNSEFIISPFLGLNFKGNVIGTNDVATDTQRWFNDSGFKRFQLGWNIGAGACYKKLYLGISYGTDFIQIAKKINTGTFKLSIGLNI